ncbi:hypothetical protein SFUMM280S_07771 [Streptomyces fumanus]
MSLACDHNGPWTVADVLSLPEDRTTRYELLGESLVMSPRRASGTSGPRIVCTSPWKRLPRPSARR